VQVTGPLFICAHPFTETALINIALIYTLTCRVFTLSGFYPLVVANLSPEGTYLDAVVLVLPKRLLSHPFISTHCYHATSSCPSFPAKWNRSYLIISRNTISRNQREFLSSLCGLSLAALFLCEICKQTRGFLHLHHGLLTFNDRFHLHRTERYLSVPSDLAIPNGGVGEWGYCAARDPFFFSFCPPFTMSLQSLCRSFSKLRASRSHA
jgi:hypothetical protein